VSRWHASAGPRNTFCDISWTFVRAYLNLSMQRKSGEKFMEKKAPGGGRSGVYSSFLCSLLLAALLSLAYEKISE
jgi:hypothetical protein